MAVTARFVPQAWIGGKAVDIGCDEARDGGDSWDVANAVRRMGRKRALGMRDGSEEAEALAREPGCPVWALAWQGPFRVLVEDSVAAHYAARDAYEYRLVRACDLGTGDRVDLEADPFADPWGDPVFTREHAEVAGVEPATGGSVYLRFVLDAPCPPLVRAFPASHLLRVAKGDTDAEGGADA